MWESRTGASAMAVELAAALILATAVSDAFGFASVSFYLLVAGVPVTAAAGLICFARVVDAVNGGRMDALGRLQATLSALLVAGIVIGDASVPFKRDVGGQVLGVASRAERPVTPSTARRS